MNITYHKATINDISTLADNRILFALELSGEQNEEAIQSLRNQMTNYFSKATANNTCISFIAKCDGIVAGIGSVPLYSRVCYRNASSLVVRESEFTVIKIFFQPTI